MAILHMNLLSNALSRTVDVDVILPLDRTTYPGAPKFEEGKPLKTLYLLHGIIGDHGDWIKGTRIALWAQDCNLCVVMPSGENGSYTDQEKAGRPWGRFLMELVELTRKMFPLSHKREDTFIGGLSMGGYGALRNGLANADTFGSIVALSAGFLLEMALNAPEESPMMFSTRGYFESVFGDLSKAKGGVNDVYALAENLVKAGKPVPEIFLCCGAEDEFAQANRDFHAHLEKLGVPHRFSTPPGAHSWDFWDTHMKEAMDTFLPLDAPLPSLHSGNITGK